MTLATVSVDQILKAPFPSYHQPLELARALARSGEDDERQRAIALLRGLSARYPHVLAIDQERVLALLERGVLDEAEHVLRGIEARFPNLDEETLCRWGRLYKDQGDRYVALPWSLPDALPADPAAARLFYRKALEKYDEAYHIRSGHYPGINTATTLLLLAAVTPAAAARERVESAGLARKLLDDRERWPIDRDDDPTVWHPATAGEAHLLLGEWEPAAQNYRRALDATRLTPHGRDSMWRQAARILSAYRALGVLDAAVFPLHELFPGTGWWESTA